MIYTLTFFSSLTQVLGRFFHGSGSGFFWIRSEFLANPDPDLEKILMRTKKPGSETLLIVDTVLVGTVRILNSAGTGRLLSFNNA